MQKITQLSFHNFLIFKKLKNFKKKFRNHMNSNKFLIKKDKIYNR